MKTLREELIDFLRWYRSEWTIPEYKKDEYSVDDYLFEKSNNYSTSDEALNSKSNWGKLYDKHSACLQGKPTYFCGCRWDNIEWCYECLNQCVENKTLFQKVWILIQLNYGSLIGWIGWQIRKFKNRNIQLPF